MSLSVRLTHRFDDFTLDVAFDVDPGVTALFGPSGSGKTTIVNAVAGLLRPDRGRVAINGTALFDTATGQWLPPHRRRIGYVFQEGRLFPHLTVDQNLRYGAWFAKSKHAPDISMDFQAIADLLGMSGLLDRQPASLSGGEKQRVAIGRALLSRPQLLLMDEPLAALDQSRKDEILPYLERLRDVTRIPILYVSHSTAEVCRLATTVVALEKGHVTGIGSATNLFQIKQRQSTALAGHVRRHDPDGFTELMTSAGPVFVPDIDHPVGTAMTLRIAADNIVITLDRPDRISALNVLPVIINAIAPGTRSEATLTLTCHDVVFLATAPRRAITAMRLRPGDHCYAVLSGLTAEPSG